MAKSKTRKPWAQQGNERAKSAANRRDQPQSRRNIRKRQKTNLRPWISAGVVLVIIAAIIAIFVYVSRQPGAPVKQPTPVSSGVLQTVSNVDPSVLEAVGTGGVQNVPQAIQNQPPLNGPTGKPEFFYFGAEYCPYCAAQRWAVVVALSRFGTFSHLNETTSASGDVYPNTPTFTFYRSSYSSQYIDFVSVENETNQVDSSGNYTILQTPTAEEQHLVDTYDAPPYVSADAQGGIPFIDIANRYLVNGPGYSPQVLSGLTWQEIADDLSNQSSPVAQGILGTANYLTAAICMTTNQQPASVCKASPIPQIEQSLGKKSVGAGETQMGLGSNHFEAEARRFQVTNPGS